MGSREEAIEGLREYDLAESITHLFEPLKRAMDVSEVFLIKWKSGRTRVVIHAGSLLSIAGYRLFRTSPGSFPQSLLADRRGVIGSFICLGLVRSGAFSAREEGC